MTSKLSYTLKKFCFLKFFIKSRFRRKLLFKNVLVNILTFRILNVQSFAVRTFEWRPIILFIKCITLNIKSVLNIFKKKLISDRLTFMFFYVKNQCCKKVKTQKNLK